MSYLNHLEYHQSRDKSITEDTLGYLSQSLKSVTATNNQSVTYHIANSRIQETIRNYETVNTRALRSDTYTKSVT